MRAIIAYVVISFALLVTATTAALCDEFAVPTPQSNGDGLAMTGFPAIPDGLTFSPKNATEPEAASSSSKTYVYRPSEVRVKPTQSYLNEAKPDTNATPGIYTMFDALFGSALKSVQVTILALLLSGAIYRVTDAFIFKTAARIKEERDIYEAALAEAASIDEEAFKCEQELSAVTEQIAVVLAAISKISPDRASLVTSMTKELSAAHDGEKAYVDKFSSLSSIFDDADMERRASCRLSVKEKFIRMFSMRPQGYVGA
jgi:hypothetical protein